MVWLVVQAVVEQERDRAALETRLQQALLKETMAAGQVIAHHSMGRAVAVVQVQQERQVLAPLVAPAVQEQHLQSLDHQ
jgi:hypothetical protein